MARFKIEYSASAQVKNNCYGCELRTNNGDCHDFCPAYKQFKQKTLIANNEYRKEKHDISLGFNQFDTSRPRATTIEHLRKKRY